MSPVRSVLAVLLLSVVASAQSVDVLTPATKVTIFRNGQTIEAKSAKEAVAKAEAGDVITLGAGTHQGPLVVKVSKVTITGEPGARVNANTADWKPAWTRDPSYGQFAYTAPMPFRPVTMAIDQRVMIDASESRGGLAVHKIGSGRNSRAALRGVFTYLVKSKTVVVSFGEDLDPAKHLIEATPVKLSTVMIDKVDGVTVSNLILTGGLAGVSLTDTDGSTVEKCLIYGVDAGVRLGEGAKSCKVLRNDITWNADALNADTWPDTADVGNDAWHAHKKYGTYDKFGIAVEGAGENNEIGHNYIYDVWNGITTFGGAGKGEYEAYFKDYVYKGISRFNKGLNVHHNRLDLTLDDALEPDGEVADNHWHGNVVTRARCATRIKTITMGPLYFYNNTLLDSLDGLRLYKSWPEQATVNVYNNLVKFKTGIIYFEMHTVAWDDPWLKAHLAKGTPGFRMYNNVFVCEEAFANNSGDKPIKPNFKGDYNVYTTAADAETQAAGIDKHALFNATPEFVDPAKGDYHLTPKSPGREAGGDLAKVSSDRPLPNWSQVPGLLETDKDRAPTGPVSGLWAIAEKPCMLGERDVTKVSLTPIRWVGGPAIEFVLAPATREALGDVPVNFIRSLPSGSSAFKVTVTDDEGKVYFEHAGKPTENDGVETKLSGHVTRYRVKIEDDKNANWRVDTSLFRVGVVAAKPVGLRKYDGVPASFTYSLTDRDQFNLTFKSKYGDTYAEATSPDGKSTKVTSDRTETVAGPKGVYRLSLQTGKSAEISIDGPDPILWFEAEKPVTLKPFWGKPKY